MNHDNNRLATGPIPTSPPTIPENAPDNLLSTPFSPIPQVELTRESTDKPSNGLLGGIVVIGALCTLGVLTAIAVVSQRQAAVAVESSESDSLSLGDQFTKEQAPAVSEANAATLERIPQLGPMEGSADNTTTQQFSPFEWENPDGSIGFLERNGKPKAIYFLAHWCPHCQAELAKIESLAAVGLQPEEVDFIAVGVLARPGEANFPPEMWLADAPFDQLMIDVEQELAAEESLAARFGLAGVPYVLYLDAELNLIERKSGELSQEEVLDDWERLAAE